MMAQGGKAAHHLANLKMNNKASFKTVVKIPPINHLWNVFGQTQFSFDLMNPLLKST
jgi:hypothetical protein